MGKSQGDGEGDRVLDGSYSTVCTYRQYGFDLISRRARYVDGHGVGRKKGGYERLLMIMIV